MTHSYVNNFFIFLRLALITGSFSSKTNIFFRFYNFFLQNCDNSVEHAVIPILESSATIRYLHKRNKLNINTVKTEF